MPSDDPRDDYIRRLVDAAPPVGPETRAALRALLAPGFEKARARREAAIKTAGLSPWYWTTEKGRAWHITRARGARVALCGRRVAVRLAPVQMRRAYPCQACHTVREALIAAALADPDTSPSRKGR